MKILTSSAVCVLLGLLSLGSFAQEPPVNEPDYNKPKLFADLPERFQLNLTAFQAILDQPVGKAIAAPFTGLSGLQGVVVSKSSPVDPNVSSVIVKLSNRQGATLTFTRIRKEDNTFRFIGRILSPNHSDAFEVVYDNGMYYFEKKHYYDLFNE